MARLEDSLPRFARSLFLGLCLAALLVPAAAASARSHKVRAPSNFFGVVTDPATAVRPDQVALMHRSGVQAERVFFDWTVAEPARGTFDFRQTDQIVGLAAANRMQVLPTVIYTPKWASSKPSSPSYFLYQPRRSGDFAAFLRALIGRYGPRGSFWAQNRSIPKRPIRQWQIWNEPAFKFFWASQPYYKTYPRLLRVAYRAIHKADHGAKVVTAGLANNQANPSWKYMKRFYKYGFRGSFDILAAHPFAATVGRVEKILRLDRDVMKQHGDGRKPIYATEMSWPASVGSIPKKDYLGFETTPAKQRSLLQQGYAALIRNRSLNVRAAYWYEWASLYTPISNNGQAVSFQYSGLLKTDAAGNFSPLPLLGAYSRVSRKYR